MHLPICSSVTNAAEKKKHGLAQIYDEICRREWSNRAARGKHASLHCGCNDRVCVHVPGDVDFDVNVASLKINEEYLRWCGCVV